GRAIDDLNLGQRLLPVIAGEQWIEARRLTRATRRKNGHLAACGQSIDQFPRPPLRLVEQRAVQRLVSHAQTVVEDDDRVQRLPSVKLAMPAGQIGPSQRGPK